jgi:protease YdgD
MMKLLRHIAGTALSLGLCTGAVFAQSNGTTDLRSLDTENEALVWQAIGRLDSAKGSYCTGTLISPDLVLTAAHCVFAGNDLVKPSDLTFQAGLTHGTAAAKRQVSQIEVLNTYDPANGMSAVNIRTDVALVRLAERIPTHELDPFVVYSGQLPKGPVSVVSYGKGRSEALSRQDQCQVVHTQTGLIALDCDLTFGSSGAPVFTHLNGRGQIVALISGGGSWGGEDVALGMILPEVVGALKRQMRANKPAPRARVKRLTVGGDKSGTGAKFVTAKGS